MTQQFLHSADVDSLFERMRSEAMAKRVRASGFWNLSFSECRFHCSLDGAFVEMESDKQARSIVSHTS